MSVSVQRLSKSAWNKKKQRSKDSNWYLCQSAIENSNYRWIQKNVWISFLLPTWKPSKSDYRNRRKPASVDILNGGLFRRVFFSLSLSMFFSWFFARQLTDFTNIQTTTTNVAELNKMGTNRSLFEILCCCFYLKLFLFLSFCLSHSLFLL